MIKPTQALDQRLFDPRQFMQRDVALTKLPVAKAIQRALSARRPRTRYAVGADAKLLAPLSRLLPDRAKDAIFGRLLGL